jgi:hypothetical protein
MREQSLYEFTCLCGRKYEISELAAFACAGCGRMLVIEWRGQHPARPQLAPMEPEEPQHEPATCSVSNPA